MRKRMKKKKKKKKKKRERRTNRNGPKWETRLNWFSTRVVHTDKHLSTTRVKLSVYSREGKSREK